MNYLLKIAFYLFSITVVLSFNPLRVFAQCGLPGTPPCPTVPKKTTPAPKTPAPKNPVLKDNNAKPKAQKSLARTAVACKVDPVEHTPTTKTQMINGVEFQFVSIPAGSFCMGEKSEFDDEQPVHKVTITKGF